MPGIFAKILSIKIVKNIHTLIKKSDPKMKTIAISLTKRGSYAVVSKYLRVENWSEKQIK